MSSHLLLRRSTISCEPHMHGKGPNNGFKTVVWALGLFFFIFVFSQITNVFFFYIEFFSNRLFVGRDKEVKGRL